MMPKTPIAVFTYNRPKHTQAMLNRLEQCFRIDDCDIFIYSDGVRNEADAAAVAETRAILQNWSLAARASFIFREENLGLKKSIETGVTDLCRQYGRVIVLEDDLLVKPNFLDYMLEALDFYEHDERVMQISAFNFLNAADGIQAAILMPLSSTWGWATWQRAWQFYSADPNEAYETMQNPKQAFSFDLDGAYPYTKMLFKVQQKALQSWGVLFWYAVWKQKGLVVYPRLSLVENIGFDGSGVNSGTWQLKQENSHADSSLVSAWNFQDSLDKSSFEKVRALIYRQIDAQKLPFIKRLMRRLKQSIKQMGKFL